MAKPEKPAATAKPTGGAKGGAAPAKTRPAGGGKPAPKEAAPPARARSMGSVPPRLRERYRTVIVPALMTVRGYTNPNQVPRLDKIVVNMGVGEAKENAKALANYAAHTSLPEKLRLEAVKTLGTWTARTGRDPVVGLWRPLPARPAEDVVAALQPTLAGLMSGSDKVRAETARLAAALFDGRPVPSDIVDLGVDASMLAPTREALSAAPAVGV